MELERLPLSRACHHRGSDVRQRGEWPEQDLSTTQASDSVIWEGSHPHRLGIALGGPKASSTPWLSFPPYGLCFPPTFSLERVPCNHALWNWGSLFPIKHKRRSGKRGFHMFIAAGILRVRDWEPQLLPSAMAYPAQSQAILPGWHPGLLGCSNLGANFQGTGASLRSICP